MSEDIEDSFTSTDESQDSKFQIIPIDIPGNQKKKKYKNQNAKKREEYMPFVLARQGYCCNQCGKTVDSLIIESQIKEEMTGVKRVLPVVVQDHIDGDSNHDDGIDGTYCGNIQYICWSCNRSKNPYRVKSLGLGSTTSREKLDRIQNFAPFMNWLHHFVEDHEHICYKEMLAGGTRHANGSVQITLSRYFEEELFTKANPNGKYQVIQYNCGSTLCNGEHVCFRGKKPQSIIEEEKKALELEWKHKYGMTEYDWKHNTSTSYKPYVSKEDYVNERLVTNI